MRAITDVLARADKDLYPDGWMPVDALTLYVCGFGDHAPDPDVRWETNQRKVRRSLRSLADRGGVELRTTTEVGKWQPHLVARLVD